MWMAEVAIGRSSKLNWASRPWTHVRLSITNMHMACLLIGSHESSW